MKRHHAIVPSGNREETPPPPCRWAGAPLAEEVLVHRQVVLRHSGGSEALLERLPAPPTAQPGDPPNGAHCLVQILNHESSYSVLQHPADRTLAKANDRCP